MIIFSTPPATGIGPTALGFPSKIRENDPRPGIASKYTIAPGSRADGSFIPEVDGGIPDATDGGGATEDPAAQGGGWPLWKKAAIGGAVVLGALYLIRR